MIVNMAMRICLWISLGFLFSTAACTFTQKVKTGMQAYEVKQYSVAAKLFEKEYNEAQSPSEKSKLAFLAGESYRFINDHGSAGIWYMKSYKDGFGEKALEQYANSMKYQERYDEALVAFEDLFQANPGNTAYRSAITLVKQAMEWSRNPVSGYLVRPANFNSTGSDYSPQPIGPGLVMFTSDRGSRDNNDNYLWTGRAYSDLFLSNSSTSLVSEYDASINSPDNDGTAVISPDGQTLVFTRCFVDGVYDAWCQLMISNRRGSSWSEPEKLPFVKEKINYGHPAFAANGTTLFFSSDAPEGQGGHDIYFVQPERSGWTEPVNLGPLVNTIGQEQYPTVYNDTLYFSSDHLPGLGGLDIFKTYLNRDNQWVSPINLKSPVNSGGDDFGFVVDTFATLGHNELLKGYFTTSREGTSRNDEIFAFTLQGEIPEVEVAVETPEETIEEKPIKYDVYLALKVVEPVFEIRDDPNSKMISTNPLPNGPVMFVDGNDEQRFNTNESGQLLIKLDLNKPYSVTGKYRDHLAETYSFNTTTVSKHPENPTITINHTLILQPIFKNKEIELENIFYDYDQWAIRDDAKPSLDELSVIMKTNPSIRIQLSSHTDCRGTDEYNQDLSQKRAQSAIEYLISVGIAARRLEAQGFGETNLSVLCECETCTEAEHQKNR
ncbi:MAG: OmpA family protein, partial [Saprospiraceae bacterium]